MKFIIASILLTYSIFCLSAGELELKNYVKKYNKCEFAFATKFDFSYAKRMFSSQTPEQKMLNGRLNDTFYCLGQFTLYSGTIKEKKGCYLVLVNSLTGNHQSIFRDNQDIYELNQDCSPELFSKMILQKKTHPSEVEAVIKNMETRGAPKDQILSVREQFADQMTLQEAVVGDAFMGRPVVLLDSSEGFFRKTFKKVTYSEILQKEIINQALDFHGPKGNGYRSFRYFKVCRPELERQCLATIVDLKKKKQYLAFDYAEALCAGTKNFQACSMKREKFE